MLDDLGYPLLYFLVFCLAYVTGYRLLGVLTGHLNWQGRIIRQADRIWRPDSIFHKADFFFLIVILVLPLVLMFVFGGR